MKHNDELDAFESDSVGVKMGVEPEYQNMGNYISLPVEVTDSLEEDILRETKMESVSNVMNLLYMDVQGHSTARISMVLGVSTREVEKIRQSTPYLAARRLLLNEILETSRKIMEVSAIKAVKTVYECMDSADDRIRLQASKEILDRVGLSGTQKLEVVSMQAGGIDRLSDSDLVEILKSALPHSEEDADDTEGV